MKELELQYVGPIAALANLLAERYTTQTATLRALIKELDARHPGLLQMFVNPQTGQLNLNTMIYYGDPGQIPAPILNLDHPIQDGGTVTFW